MEKEKMILVLHAMWGTILGKIMQKNGKYTSLTNKSKYYLDY